jgi:LytS/YehU family sensor histidine kinase
MAVTTTQKSMAIPLTALAVGAVVALLVGVIGRVHNPTLAGTTTLGYSTVLAILTSGAWYIRENGWPSQAG